MKDQDPSTETQHALELKLNGEMGAIDAKTVVDGLELLRKLVGSFTPGQGPVKMASLRSGSAVTGVVATPEVETTILRAIDSIRDHKEMPSNWSSKQATLLQDLAKLSNRSGVDSTELSGSSSLRVTQLDSALLASIQEAMKKTPISIGSVVGTLYSYQVSAKGLSAKMRDSLTNEDVRVLFDEDLDEAIRSNLRGLVEVSGVLKRHPETNAPEEISAKSVEALPIKTVPVSGRGIWRRLKEEGTTAQDMMRALRSEGTNAHGS
ncbi:hypothetical protein [Corynebacterium sp. Marseille-P3884]|uniref:hypothetical protein n=1 Tax=Corynebacterium sp. Marseille-P3884 TaxID=2495409 RepID=UPI001B33D576|nr:hypothetical protein [Corynebacterium sp. Marseille-P3884]MBP3947306.1 hypothetical protein [Corynebacterium sp. Marseille-P3884]